MDLLHYTFTLILVRILGQFYSLLSHRINNTKKAKWRIQHHMFVSLQYIKVKNAATGQWPHSKIHHWPFIRTMKPLSGQRDVRSIVIKQSLHTFPLQYYRLKLLSVGPMWHVTCRSAPVSSSASLGLHPADQQRFYGQHIIRLHCTVQVYWRLHIYWCWFSWCALVTLWP